MKKFLFYISIFIMVSCETEGQKIVTTPHEVSIPFNMKSRQVKPPWSLADMPLQTELQGMINEEVKWKRLVQQKKMAVGLVVLNDTSNIKFARINGSEIMYAASLPKIAILLAAMDALEKGEIEETEELKADMHLMIARSDNQAATRTMDKLGFEKIEKVLTDPKYLLYDEEHGGGLWVGKRYAKTGRRYPEPIKGISHAATVTQVCRFYYLLINGQLVNFDRSSQMLAIMEDPELHHKFVNSLEKVAPRAKLFRKSGSWQNFHADSILVWGPERKYILVALTEDPDGEKILRDLALKVDNILVNLN
jgi:beta-lactamase class A